MTPNPKLTKLTADIDDMIEGLSAEETNFFACILLRGFVIAQHRREIALPMMSVMLESAYEQYAGKPSEDKVAGTAAMIIRQVMGLVTSRTFTDEEHLGVASSFLGMSLTMLIERGISADEIVDFARESIAHMKGQGTTTPASVDPVKPS